MLRSFSTEYVISKQLRMRYEAIEQAIEKNQNCRFLSTYRSCGFIPRLLIPITTEHRNCFPKGISLITLWLLPIFHLRYIVMKSLSSKRPPVHTKKQSFRSNRRAYEEASNQLGVEDAYASMLILNDIAVRIVISIISGEKSRMQQIIWRDTSRRKTRTLHFLLQIAARRNLNKLLIWGFVRTWPSLTGILLASSSIDSYGMITDSIGRWSHPTQYICVYCPATLRDVHSHSSEWCEMCGSNNW